MEKWEHKVVSVPFGYEDSKRTLAETDHAGEGWQLVSVCPWLGLRVEGKDRDYLLMFFRRQRP